MLRAVFDHSTYTAEALKSDCILFETRTPPHYGLDVTNHQAPAAFVGRIEKIRMTEVNGALISRGRRLRRPDHIAVVCGASWARTPLRIFPR